jgi:hypothetical protein
LYDELEVKLPYNVNRSSMIAPVKNDPILSANRAAKKGPYRLAPEVSLRLPRKGETISGAGFENPGNVGKGAPHEI